MKKIALLLVLMMVLPLSVAAQMDAQFTSEATLVSLAKDKKTVTLKCMGMADKKKEALVMAQKSALYTLLHVGVEGVNGGKPLCPVADPAYDRRMFGDDDRYTTFVANSTDLDNYGKVNGKVTAMVEVTFYLQALQRDLGKEPGVTANKNLPSITILPFIAQNENQMEVLEGNSVRRSAAASVTAMFNKKGYLTKDYLSMIRNLQNDDILLAGTQSDAVTKMLQNAGTDVKVEVRCHCSKGAANLIGAVVEIKAVEAFTGTTLASVKLTGQNRGDSILVVEQVLESTANAQKRNLFFQELNKAFSAIALQGLEVNLNMAIDEAVDDFSFEDELEDGKVFRDVLEEWLLQEAVDGNARIDMANGKYLGITLRVPFYDQNGKPFKVSGFRKTLKKKMQELLGDDHTFRIDALGQKMAVIIQ